MPIQRVKLASDNPHYAELRELQLDAFRIIRQAQQLRLLRPDRHGSYADQEIACLNEINRQANKVQNKL